MRYKHALVVSRHHKHLADNPLEYRLHLGSLRYGNVDSIIRRKLEVLIDRMILLSKLTDYRSFCRPWKLALVLDKVFRELIIHRSLLAAR